MVVVEDRKLHCWHCKQNGNLAKSCGQKTSAEPKDNLKELTKADSQRPKQQHQHQNVAATQIKSWLKWCEKANGGDNKAQVQNLPANKSPPPEESGN